jgi:trimethylamine--corrinoid protein Co-methyltransferase
MLSLRTLSDHQLEQVRDATEKLLERTGCRVPHPDALALCRKAGARVDETSGTVRLPRQLLRELIQQAPDTYTMTGVDDETYTVGDGTPWCMAIVTDPWIIDYETREPRRPRLADVVRNTVVGQQLDDVCGMSCMDFPVTDVDTPTSNLRALEAHLLHHTKHNFVYPTSVESLRRWLEIGRILARGGDLRGSRLFSVGVPTLSPMTVLGPNVEVLKIACDHDFPVIPTVCPTAGVTSPFTLAGTLTQGNAENLFVLALSQLFRPGHPFLYTFGPGVGDMRDAGCLYYTVDKFLWKTAHVQLAKSYGLPVAAECGGTMVGRFDQQSGAEGMLFMLAAVASGADLLPGFGSTYNAVGHSTEMMLIQMEYFRAARFLATGMRIDPEHLALDAIDAVGAGGQFLTDESTLKYLRGGQFFDGDLFDQSGKDSGVKPLLERAHAQVGALVEGFESPVPGGVQEQLKRFFHDQLR